jgi:hypothetical protein
MRSEQVCRRIGAIIAVVFCLKSVSQLTVTHSKYLPMWEGSPYGAILVG